MKRLVLWLGIVAVLLGAGGGVYYFKFRNTEVTPEDAYHKAQELLAQGKAREALIIASKYGRLPEGTPGSEFEWTDLELQAAIALDSVPRMIHLFRDHPEAFDNYEDTVLKLARLHVQFQQVEQYDVMRERWKGRETKVHDWFLLDVDKLIMAGEYLQAEELLKSKQFTGDQEISRLVRLALTVAKRDLNQAWDHLGQAYQLNPRSTDVRSFRAQILESVDQLALARVEYMAAFVADPENPLMRDQLAEFYRRHKQYFLALSTWTEGLEAHSADYIWLKTLFWSRTAIPVRREWDMEKIPNGQLKPLVQFVTNLPDGQFWDEEAFRVLPETRFYLLTRQETYWLRLLQELREGDEQAALNLLEENPFARNCWDADLVNALRQVLTYRQSRFIPLPAKLSSGAPVAQHQPAVGQDEIVFGDTKQNKHQFLTTLNELALAENLQEEMPEDLQALLLSEEAIAATFVAAGWLETAVQFRVLPVIPEQFPSWVSFGMTQALRTTRGAEAALRYANSQPRTAFLDLLRAEILIGLDQKEKAVTLLEQLTEQEEGIGFRASWLLARHYLEVGNLEKAQRAIDRNDDLDDHVMGKELEAKIALEKGDKDLAEAIFGEIQDKSFIAKSYLAKVAFENNDFARAKDLTQQMIREYPDILQLRANLKAILEAEREAGEAHLRDPAAVEVD